MKLSRPLPPNITLEQWEHMMNKPVETGDEDLILNSLAIAMMDDGVQAFMIGDVPYDRRADEVEKLKEITRRRKLYVMHRRVTSKEYLEKRLVKNE